MPFENEKYLIVVEYDNAKYYFDEAEIYYKYKDCVGQKVSGTLQTNTYDNGNIKQYVFFGRKGDGAR